MFLLFLIFLVSVIKFRIFSSSFLRQSANVFFYVGYGSYFLCGTLKTLHFVLLLKLKLSQIQLRKIENVSPSLCIFILKNSSVFHFLFIVSPVMSHSMQKANENATEENCIKV